MAYKYIRQQIFTCDRCGKEHSETLQNGDLEILIPQKWLSLATKNLTVNACYILCGECRKSFYEWLKI